jgi:hypothetical protein
MNAPVRMHFNPEFNWGHIFVVASVIVSAMGMMIMISRDLADARTMREKYIPIIEAAIQTDNIQSERISNLIVVQGEQREINERLRLSIVEIGRQLAEINEAHAALKARLDASDGRFSQPPRGRQ